MNSRNTRIEQTKIETRSLFGNKNMILTLRYRVTCIFSFTIWGGSTDVKEGYKKCRSVLNTDLQKNYEADVTWTNLIDLINFYSN